MGTNVPNATINNRVKKKLQIAFRRLMLGNYPSSEMKLYTGMDSYELKRHIGSMMLPEMNWNNYGEVWVVEHLVAIGYFDLTSVEERKLAYHPLNLIPILKKDMRFKEGNIHFSLELLQGLPDSDAKANLIKRVEENMKRFDEYINAYVNGKYYNPMQ